MLDVEEGEKRERNGKERKPQGEGARLIPQTWQLGDGSSNTKPSCEASPHRTPPRIASLIRGCLNAGRHAAQTGMGLDIAPRHKSNPPSPASLLDPSSPIRSGQYASTILSISYSLPQGGAPAILRYIATPRQATPRHVFILNQAPDLAPMWPTPCCTTS